MEETFNEAIEELKRADHLIFVSLKYTRTVDVIKNVIERLINCFDCIIGALLKKQISDEKLEEIPSSVVGRVNEIKKLYPDDRQIIEWLDFYMVLRSISKAKFDRSMEYRRHVTMTATLVDGTVMQVDIDRIHEYFDKTKEFIEYARNIMFKTEQS